jgi:hypothetical protein
MGVGFGLPKPRRRYVQLPRFWRSVLGRIQQLDQSGPESKTIFPAHLARIGAVLLHAQHGQRLFLVLIGAGEVKNGRQQARSEEENGHKSAIQLASPPPRLIVPPPLCMFFTPSFHDLQNGKIGVWKGDLDIRRKGGGKFSVLIVGEEATGHIW